jgi:hypothetical protein
MAVNWGGSANTGGIEAAINRFLQIWAWLCVAFVLALLFAIALFFLSEPVHASNMAPRPNSLGVQETYQNPNTYLLALPVAAQVLDGRFTNIRFQPYKAAALFDESVLFCGDVTDEFRGTSGVLVVTYLTRASGRYEGVGCHNLQGVFEAKTQQVRLGRKD